MAVTSAQPGRAGALGARVAFGVFAIAFGLLALASCGARVEIDGPGGANAAGAAGASQMPPADPRACVSDLDCVHCVFTAAPRDRSECENTLGCCGGQIVNAATCAFNEAAWQANCSGEPMIPPSCPCITCGTSIAVCAAGQCGLPCPP